nr:hypothetical protein HJG63_011803 [Rousettus aegyptiacus]
MLQCKNKQTNKHVTINLLPPRILGMKRSGLRGGLRPNLHVFLPQHLGSLGQVAAVSQNAGAWAHACSCTTSKHETREVTSSQPGVSERVFAYLKHVIWTKSRSFRRNNTQVHNDTAKGPEEKHASSVES